MVTLDFDVVSFFADIVADELCTVTGFFIESFVVLDVITASICSCDNDDVCEIFV